ncbi:MAG: metal-dependent hydrolase [bacterium]|nr:metal-dependent hydrolase [bacterium]
MSETNYRLSSLRYLGHSTTILTLSANGNKDENFNIIIDPWLAGNPSCPPQWHSPKIEAVVLTHGHSDHTASAPALMKNCDATLFATFELATLLCQKEGVPAANLQFMNKGGSVPICHTGAKLTLTQAFHSSSFDASDGITYYAGEAAGALITTANEESVYHAGDTCFFDDMEDIGRNNNIAVALLPIGDRFTMGPKDAARAAALLGAKKIIPIHYATFGLLSGTADAFYRELRAIAEKLADSLVVLKPGEAASL